MSNYKLRIKEFRKIRGLTQKQLAHKIGISRSFLCEIENGKYDIRLSLLLKISVVLDVNPWVLADFYYI